MLSQWLDDDLPVRPDQNLARAGSVVRSMMYPSWPDAEDPRTKIIHFPPGLLYALAVVRSGCSPPGDDPLAIRDDQHGQEADDTVRQIA